MMKETSQRGAVVTGATKRLEKESRPKRSGPPPDAVMETSVVDAAMTFAEMDRDGNQRLDFDEFYAMQSQRVRDANSNADIRKWFDAADTDGCLLYTSPSPRDRG